MVIRSVYGMSSLSELTTAPAKRMACALWWSDSGPGGKKTELPLGGWLKAVAPSPELRKWFGHSREVAPIPATVFRRAHGARTVTPALTEGRAPGTGYPGLQLPRYRAQRRRCPEGLPDNARYPIEGALAAAYRLK